MILAGAFDYHQRQTLLNLGPVASTSGESQGSRRARSSKDETDDSDNDSPSTGASKTKRFKSTTGVLHISVPTQTSSFNVQPLPFNHLPQARRINEVAVVAGQKRKKGISKFFSDGTWTGVSTLTALI